MCNCLEPPKDTSPAALKDLEEIMENEVSVMISVAEALSLIAFHRPKPIVETLTLREALGRRLAVDISARLTQPPLDASAMDGYAVRLSEIGAAGAQLDIIGEAPAGTPFSGSISKGQAVRVFTGGAIPSGADTVIIQENVHADGPNLRVIDPQDAARHIRRAGIDFRKGDKLIKAGTLMGPAQITVAAASGHAQLSVNRKLHAAILSGGDELVSPGDTPKSGQIVNSNPFALAALIESWGHQAVILPTAKDTLDSLAMSIESAAEADVIIAVGGASVGDHDYMRAAFQAAGLEMVFEKIAVRPGKPTWFGHLQGRPVLGLPGNPASALVCAQLFAKPLFTGERAQFVTAQLTEGLKANGSRESYQRAVAILSGITLTVAPLPLQDSGLITPFLTANGLIKLPPNNGALTVGDLVEVLLIKPII